MEVYIIITRECAFNFIIYIYIYIKIIKVSGVVTSQVRFEQTLCCKVRYVPFRVSNCDQKIGYQSSRKPVALVLHSCSVLRLSSRASESASLFHYSLCQARYCYMQQHPQESSLLQKKAISRAVYQLTLCWKAHSPGFAWHARISMDIGFRMGFVVCSSSFSSCN